MIFLQPLTPLNTLSILASHSLFVIQILVLCHTL